MQKRVYDVPAEIDDEVSWVKLHAMGLEIDRLTEAQRDYLAGWQV